MPNFYTYCEEHYYQLVYKFSGTDYNCYDVQKL
jgi:hypothetical protein